MYCQQHPRPTYVVDTAHAAMLLFLRHAQSVPLPSLYRFITTRQPQGGRARPHPTQRDSGSPFLPRGWWWVRRWSAGGPARSPAQGEHRSRPHQPLHPRHGTRTTKVTQHQHASPPAYHIKPSPPQGSLAPQSFQPRGQGIHDPAASLYRTRLPYPYRSEPVGPRGQHTAEAPQSSY